MLITSGLMLCVHIAHAYIVGEAYIFLAESTSCTKGNILLTEDYGFANDIFCRKRVVVNN